MTGRHFLRLDDLSGVELEHLLDFALRLKGQPLPDAERPLAARTLAMIFEKVSTRTRVSFETAMHQLGGHAIFLGREHTQLGRGESIEDTARVLSSMVDIIMLRTHSHERLLSFASASRVPVINGLSDAFHPCQLLADLLTYRELRGELRGRTVAWLGDGGSNVCQSYILAAGLCDFQLRIATPPECRPDPELLAAHAERVSCGTDPRAMARGADLLVTDVWASMGQEREAARRQCLLQAYRVNAALFALAAPDALFLHCLPAHRGEEVDAEVLDGPRSAAWSAAENRLHAQKALLLWLLKGRMVDPAADSVAASVAASVTQAP